MHVLTFAAHKHKETITLTFETIFLFYTGPCKNLSAPKNGMIIRNGYKHKETITFGCRKGFEMIGAPDRICNFGVWSNAKIPRCEGKDFWLFHHFCYGHSPVDATISILQQLIYAYPQIVNTDIIISFLDISRSKQHFKNAHMHNFKIFLIFFIVVKAVRHPGANLRCVFLSVAIFSSCCCCKML